MTYDFLPEARDELSEAVFYYESKEPGLGARFRREIEQVAKRIAANPYLWHERPGGYRRVNCRIFPYYVAYFVRGEKIVIAAVAGGPQKPEYWRRRISSV